MRTDREEINVVWFKRDLRLQDNEAIYNAITSSKRTLFIYVFEKTLIEDPHYSERHWNFIKQSLEDLNNNLKNYNTKILIATTEIFTVLNQLQNYYKINNGQ